MSIGSSKIGSSGTPSFLSSGLSSELQSSLSEPSGGSIVSNPSGGSVGSGNSNPSDLSGGSSLVSSGSAGSSGGGNTPSGSGDEFSYIVSAAVDVSYTPGWSVVYMMSGQKVGAAAVHDDGDSAGGLICDWADFPPANTIQSIIQGAYGTEESFDFTFYPSETETIDIFRLVQVQNTGGVDILVNGSPLAPGDTAVGLSSSDTNPWGYVMASVSVTLA